jgi:hypothetical protein
MVFNIDYTIGDIEQLIADSLDGLIYDNRGNIGNQATQYLSFDVVGGPSECDTTANKRSYLFEGSPIVDYPKGGGRAVVSSMFNNGFVDSFTFRPQTDPVGGAIVNTPAALDSGWVKGSSGEFTTQDSTLGLVVDYWMPGDGDLTLDDDWVVVFARVCMTNRTAGPITDAYLAYGWDWDVPSIAQAQNLSAFVTTPGSSTMYMQGASDTSTVCLDDDRRFAGVRYFQHAEVENFGQFVQGGGAGVAGFQSLYTRDNATFVNAEWDALALDSMLVNISGFDAFTTVDPALINGTDLHMVLNSGAYDLDPDDTVYLYMAMIAGIAQDNTDADITAIDATMAGWSPWTSGTCCDAAGDANNDGGVTIGDVTFLIARIFSGGGPPPCCEEGDANGDGSITIGDVTYLIARIFSGGGPPICGPAGMTCGAQ